MFDVISESPELNGNPEEDELPHQTLDKHSQFQNGQGYQSVFATVLSQQAARTPVNNNFEEDITEER